MKAGRDVPPRLPFWLGRGRLGLKRKMTEAATDAAPPPLLPLQPEVVALVARSRAAGRRTELVTAADQGLVDRHADLGRLFDAVVGSGADGNLKGEAKTALLRERHPDGFAYVGNSAADLPVWRAAAERFGVNLAPSVRRAAEKDGLALVELAPPAPLLPALVRAARPHQWLKNLLILVPLLLVATTASLATAAEFVAAFLLLSLLTSGTYLANDLLDLEADRRHPRKRFRPIASGDLPIPVAAAAAALLILGALAGSALLLGPPFLAVALAYLVLTLAYSFRLKQVVILDVMVIAALFVLRVLGGMVLLGQPPSPWLLMFSAFFFLSLALMKREVELNAMPEAETVTGRGYLPGDRTFVVAFGIASGVASLVVFALFISAMSLLPGSSYGAPAVFWLALPVVAYWLARMWLLTARGQMNDDPILYALRDRASLVLGGLTVIAAVAAPALHL